MLVRELMTSPAFSVHEDDDVAHALEVLDRRNVTSLPVVDEVGRILGLIGEADMIRQVVESGSTLGQHRRHVATLVSDVMTRDVLTIRADDDIAAALAAMNNTGLQSLPVVLHDRVAGMLSRRDIIRALAHGSLADNASAPVGA